MPRNLATLTIALSLVGAAPVAHADGSLFVHGYQGTNYGSR
jgi:hypothetical protein